MTNETTPPPGAQAAKPSGLHIRGIGHIHHKPDPPTPNPAPEHCPLCGSCQDILFDEEREYACGTELWEDSADVCAQSGLCMYIAEQVNSAAEARALLERCRDLCDSPYRGEDFQRAMTLSADIKRFLAGAPPDAPT